MSYHTLQNLVVRLLYDESFAAAVYADSDGALAGLDLTENERRQLLSVDRRAWRHDALLSKRTLRTLVEEFKISTTIVLAETRSLASLERFFASSFFHAAITERGSLAQAFAEFLRDGCTRGRWTAPQLADSIALEAALAACRRTLAREGEYVVSDLPATISDRTRIKLAPGYDVIAVQANLIAAIQQVEHYLFEVGLLPAMALCDDAPRLPRLPEVEQQQKNYLLLGPGAAGISLTNLDQQSYLVLRQARRAQEIKRLLARVALAGVKARQAQETLAEGLENGILMVVT